MASSTSPQLHDLGFLPNYQGRALNASEWISMQLRTQELMEQQGLESSSKLEACALGFGGNVRGGPRKLQSTC